jgi:hypothetical protein
MRLGEIPCQVRSKLLKNGVHMIIYNVGMEQV